MTNPTFSVETPHNIWSTGDGWIEGTTVTLTIDDPSNGVGTDYTDTTSMETWGPEPHETGFNFNTDPFVIEPTHIVTATDGTNIKELTVVSVTVDTIDEINATLAGMAPANAFVEVNAGDDVSNAHRSVQADGSGVWAADFSVPGPQDHENETMSFGPGVGGAAETYDDDGDGNHRSWRILSPRFKAGVDNDDLSGWEWLPNATVDISIDGGTPYSYQTDEWGNFGGGVALDLNVGQYLVATDGISTKDFVIRNLYVTSVDVDNDLVHGTSTPGDVVQVETHGEDGQWREVTADGVTGDWTADFSVVWEDQAVFDIVSGSSGNARYYEPDGDETQRSWHVSDPRITASVNHEEVWTYDFPDEPDGQMLYYRLDDPATAEIDFEGTMPLLVQDGSTQSGDHSFGRFDVQAGHTFTVRNRPFDVPLDGGMERVLAISHVTVDSVDPDLDVITGTADPAEGPRVCVWSNDAELCDDNPGFTWNPDNTWAADFGSIGSDVAPGHWNSASQFETDGDETHYWWNLPPWIVVELAEEDDGGVPLWPDAVRVEQWTGPIVYLEIDGNPIAQWTYEESWDYTFELPGFDIEPGHIVRVHDSADDKTVLVEPLTIDQVNFSGDVPPNTVEGTTSPYRDVRVEASASVGGWWAERWVNSDSSGNFTADFGVPGNGWREQWTAELGGAEGLGRNMRLELYDSDNDRVTTRQCEGLERIEIARSDGRVDAFDFPEGSTVTLEIDDPATGQGVDYTDTAIAVRNPENPCETIATFDLGGYEIPDEATVSAGDGETTVTTIVIAFTIDNVNPDADTVSGQAAIGADVYVEADGNWRYVVAEDDPSDGVDVGYWVADFSVQGSEPGEEQIVDLGPGSSGRAIMLDDVGNTTELSWRISAAQFAVSPAEDNIDGWEWLPNDQVTITVNSVAVPGSPFDTDDWGNLDAWWDPAELDIVAGDVVVVSDGDSIKDHTVTDLVVIGVDEVSDVVSGIALPGSSVDVWVHEPEAGLTVTADGFGDWSADFSGMVDLVPGSNGNSGQCDTDNDCTNAGWRIPNAQLAAIPADDSVHGEEWLPNSPVTVTVNGVEVPGSPIGTDDGGNFDHGWDPGEMDLVAGDVVVVSDGDSTKEHTVTTLVVTSVDEAADVVSGLAEPGSAVGVWVHETEANLEVTACNNSGFPCNGDAIGTWHADFSGMIDLVPSSEGNSGQWDEDDDATWAFWRVRGLPELGVSATHDIIEGYDFAGDTVTFTFDSNEDPTDGALFEETTELDPDGSFFRPLEGDFDVQVGQFVTVTDGITTKTTRVAPVDVTVVDLVNDTITGIADAEAEVFVDGFGDLHHTVIADEFGVWFLDLAGEVNLEVPAIVVPDQRDDDNDRTFALWETPATVEGHVLLDGEPLADVEVWLAPDNYTCTDTDGYFVFDEASMLDAAIHGAFAATGPAVNGGAECVNAEFVDGDGIPLLVGFHGDFDLWDGYEYIEFNVERAAGLQTVIVEEYDGADWVPLDDVVIRAFDMNDPDFVAAYGNDPDHADYRDIFEGDPGQIDMTWTGAYLFSPPGSSELRYPTVTDVLILAETPYGMILGDQTSAADFVDGGDGVYVGPVVIFRIGPPVITAMVGPDEPIAVDTEATILATFMDPTVDDSHTSTIEWGDGTTTDADVFFDAGEGTATGAHTYAEAGVYAVTVTVTDSVGLLDSGEFQYVVVYDPDGGFVTGGGWIYSPAGAYAADPTLEGRANFGFVSKYKKGKTAPTGNTEFQFQAGDLNFHSGVYDWLVIAGARALFKGTGTINGTGEFGFMLTALDEALTPSADVDLFRIKIWDKATDEIVYDNQMDDVDGAAVTTEISGGSIVIHKAKK